MKPKTKLIADLNSEPENLAQYTICQGHLPLLYNMTP